MKYRAGHRLRELSPADDKDLFVIDRAGHYGLYRKPEYAGSAIERLTGFYRKHLGG